MKEKIQLVLGVLVLSLVMHGMSGCAPVVHKPNYAMREPPYPNAPKIAYLRSYYGGSNQKLLSVFETILGEDASVKLESPVQPVVQGDTLYVTLKGVPGILVLDTTQNTYSVITSIGDVTLKDADGLAVSSTGDIYVSDTTAGRIYVADAKGNLKRTIGKDLKFRRLGHIALDETRDRLYVVDRDLNTVKALKTTGELLFEFGGKGDQDGQFNMPHGIAVDKRNGRIVVTDPFNWRVQVFDDQGKFLLKFGENSDASAGFGGVRGVAVNNEGHIYVSDAMLQRISVFNDAGAVLMNFGAPGAPPGYFQLPNGIAFDDKDRLYVADSYNGRVQVFQYLSEQWKKEYPEEYDKYSAKPPDVQKPDATKQKKDKKETKRF